MRYTMRLRTFPVDGHKSEGYSRGARGVLEGYSLTSSLRAMRYTMRLGTFPVDGHKDAPDFYQCQFEVCPKFRYRSSSVSTRSTPSSAPSSTPSSAP